MDKSDEGQAFSGNRDLYYRGVISKLFPSNDMGLVRTQSGREIAFTYSLVILLGQIKSPDDLTEGQEVGYDVGWTPSGFKVVKIKTYPEFLPEGGDPDLEGQGNQGQQTPS